MSIKKKVTFNENVIVHRLVRPDIVYYCQKPLVSQLDLDQHGPIRKLQGQPMKYCTCNLCRTQKSACAQTACDMCFSCGKFSETTVLGQPSLAAVVFH